MKYLLNSGRILEIEPLKECPICHGSGWKQVYNNNRWDKKGLKQNIDKLCEVYVGTNMAKKLIDQYNALTKTYSEVTVICDCVEKQVDEVKTKSESFIL